MVRFPTHFHKFLKAAGLQSLVEPDSIKKGILLLPFSSAWALPSLKARAMSRPLLPPFLAPLLSLELSPVGAISPPRARHKDVHRA